MSDSKQMTESLCNQVRSACSSQVKERYEAMKELFLSKLEGVSDNLEIILIDVQKSLSLGSKRMSEIADMSTRRDDKLEESLSESKSYLTEACLKLESRISESAHDLDEKVQRVDTTVETLRKDMDAEFKDVRRPPWQLISIIIVVVLAVGGSMMITWRQVGIMEERISQLKATQTRHIAEDGEDFAMFEKRWESILKNEHHMSVGGKVEYDHNP